MSDAVVNALLSPGNSSTTEGLATGGAGTGARASGYVFGFAAAGSASATTEYSRASALS